MNDLQWLGLFLVIFGLAGAFLISWYFERKEAENYQFCKFIIKMNLRENFAINCERSSIFNFNELKKPPKPHIIEQVRKSTMLEF